MSPALTHPPSADGGPSTPPGWVPRSPIFWYAAVTLLVVAAVARAAGLATVNDDAFISFRYAQQFLEGHGLVYNPGERVEGYTNFLWTVIVAAGMALGVDPVGWSLGLGVCFFAGTILLAAVLSRRMTGDRTGLVLSLPIAAIALVLHRDAGVYATSGLETSMQTFLVTLLLVLLATGTDTRRILAAGLTLVAAMMTRPDAVVVGVAAALFLLTGGPGRVRRVALFALPSALLFLPYWLIRWDYYGAFFPNAFHAKSIALPYYEQGFEYVKMYFTSYTPLLLVLPLLIYHYLFRRGEGARGNDGSAIGTAGRVILLGSLIAGLFTLFVIRIGGDFMFARFLIPITPAAYLALEALIRSVAGRTRRSAGAIAVGLALVVLAGTFFRYDHFSDRNQIGYIADEWQRYPLSSLDETKKTGAILRRAFDGLPVRVAFWGGQARLMYYAQPHHAIEAMTGLTDTAIARQPIDERGRPGHEKEARLDYLLSRGVDFYFRPFAPPPPGAPALNLIVFDSVAARIVSYRNEVMEALRLRPGVRFTPMPEFLDDYLGTLGTKNLRDVAADYAWLREFYFRHNEDPAREQPFREFLGR